MSKEYFPHDYAARLSLRGIRKDYGMEGVGFYWCFVEILHEEGGYVKERDFDDIAYDLQADPEMCSAIVHNYGLFSVRKGKIHSDRVLRNIKKRADVSAARRKAAEERWGGNEPADENEHDSKQEPERGPEKAPEAAREKEVIPSSEEADEREFEEEYEDELKSDMNFYIDQVNIRCDEWRDELMQGEKGNMVDPPSDYVKTRLVNLFKLIGTKRVQKIGGQTVDTAAFMEEVVKLFRSNEKRLFLCKILADVDKKASKGEVKNKQNYIVATLWNTAMLNEET